MFRQHPLNFCKKLKPQPHGWGFNCSGSVLCSRAVARQVFSALRSLTSVFGMGTGVSFSLSPPNRRNLPLCSFRCKQRKLRLFRQLLLSNWKSLTFNLFCSLSFQKPFSFLGTLCAFRRFVTYLYRQLLLSNWKSPTFNLFCSLSLAFLLKNIWLFWKPFAHFAQTLFSNWIE